MKYGKVFNDPKILEEAVERASTRTDRSFLACVPNFLSWLDDNGLNHLTKDRAIGKKVSCNREIPDEVMILINAFRCRREDKKMQINFCTTGKKNKEIIEYLSSSGLVMSGTVSNKTFVLLTDNHNSSSSKMTKAEKLGTRIVVV